MNVTTMTEGAAVNTIATDDIIGPAVAEYVRGDVDAAVLANVFLQAAMIRGERTFGAVYDEALATIDVQKLPGKTVGQAWAAFFEVLGEASDAGFLPVRDLDGIEESFGYNERPEVVIVGFMQAAEWSCGVLLVEHEYAAVKPPDNLLRSAWENIAAARDALREYMAARETDLGWRDVVSSVAVAGVPLRGLHSIAAAYTEWEDPGVQSHMLVCSDSFSDWTIDAIKELGEKWEGRSRDVIFDEFAVVLPAETLGMLQSRCRWETTDPSEREVYSTNLGPVADPEDARCISVWDLPYSLALKTAAGAAYCAAIEIILGRTLENG